jgi:hypothetical protein
MSAESWEISRTLPDQIQGPPSPLYNGYWGSFPVVLSALSIHNSVVSFVRDSAPLVTSMLSARPPVLRYPRVKKIFHMMDIVNSRLRKKHILDLSSSVRPIKSWNLPHWEYAYNNPEHHSVPFCGHVTNDTHKTSLISLNATNKCNFLHCNCLQLISFK